MNSNASLENAPAALMALSISWLAGLVWSGWAPRDRITWIMEAVTSA